MSYHLIFIAVVVVPSKEAGDGFGQVQSVSSLKMRKDALHILKPLRCYALGNCKNLFSWRCQKQPISRLPTHNPRARSYRGVLRMYLWYFKKKGGILAISDTKVLCRDWFVLPRQGDVGQKCQHLAVGATCCQHSQPSCL